MNGGDLDTRTVQAYVMGNDGLRGTEAQETLCLDHNVELHFNYTVVTL